MAKENVPKFHTGIQKKREKFSIKLDICSIVKKCFDMLTQGIKFPKIKVQEVPATCQSSKILCAGLTCQHRF